MYGAFYTKIRGVSWEGRQRLISRLNMSGQLEVGTPLELVREPDNPFDGNAVAVRTANGDMLGYLNKDINGGISEKMRRGVRYRVTVSSVTGGIGIGNYGINIKVEEIG